MTKFLLLNKNLTKIGSVQIAYGIPKPRCVTTKVNRTIMKDDEKRKCDPRPPPKGPPKFNLGKSVGKWVRKYITGAAEPKKPPPHDPRPVCTPCLLTSSPLPPFPKLHSVYEGVMEHTGNQPPLDDQTVFLLKQTLVVSEHHKDREIAMLNYIEADEHVRDFHDPIPKFSNSAQRMVDLVDKKLHPSYKQNLRLNPLDCHLVSKYFFKRQTKPPIRIRYNLRQLNKKNFYVDHKRCEIPSPTYCTKALELKQNEKNMLDAKKRGKVKEMLKIARLQIERSQKNPPSLRKIGETRSVKQEACN